MILYAADLDMHGEVLTDDETLPAFAAPERTFAYGDKIGDISVKCNL